MDGLLSIQDVLARDGVLSRRLEGFRERCEQIRMAEAVGGAIAEGSHLLVEAPTGTGKSLAYLVPAVLAAVAEGRKVVITTHTIALQEQLVEKDLPLLQACLPIEFTVTKALGRTNYLGLRRMALALDEGPGLVADDPLVEGLRSVREWSETALEGRRQELDPAPSPEVWEQVRSESDNCLGQRCATFHDCFYQAARRRLQTSDVIVTNHALYCTDLMLRQADAGILPEHDILVIDEAHHFERVASDHLGLEISRRDVRFYLRRLTGGRRSRGLLHRVPKGGTEEVRAAARRVSDAATAFFDAVDVWFTEHPGGHGRYRQPAFVEDYLSGPLHELAECLEVLADAQEKPEIGVELDANAQRALAYASVVRQLLAVDDPDLVYFIERDVMRRSTLVCARPLDVAPILEEQLFDRLNTVVVTSATLASGRDPQDLAYAERHLGCTGADHLVLGSPFDLERLVAVHAPRDLPAPDDPEHEERAAEMVLRYIDRTGGGAFLLFTSYRALEGYWRRLCEPLRMRGLLALRQGEAMDRGQMLRRFREDGNAVLFGADSFWHGVDVPGPALRLVVIARLPFPVPTLPLNEARSERLRRLGEDPFSSFTLPEAVIRFRQGCGRLVRKEDDEGLILCLDPRILTKPYGVRFRGTFGELSWSDGEIPEDEASAAQ